MKVILTKKNLKKNLQIILEGGGSGYASGDIAQVIVKNLFKTLFYI
jgi:hypothetical protein